METNQLQSIEKALRQVLTEGGSGNFVIFHHGSNSDYFLQVAGGKGGSRFWIEASTVNSLTDEQHQQLKDIGWNHPSRGGLYNYFVEKKGISADNCPEIAEFMLKTFREVYQLSDEMEIRVELVFQ